MCADIGKVTRARYRRRGDSRRPKTYGVFVRLRRVDLEAMKLSADFYGRIGERDTNTPDKLATDMVRAQLSTVFRRCSGMTLGDFERLRLAGKQFAWRGRGDDSQIEITDENLRDHA